MLVDEGKILLEDLGSVKEGFSTTDHHRTYEIFLSVWFFEGSLPENVLQFPRSMVDDQ